MELTVNTFTKGLLKDTNPMIQGTDTLTDALNATIVTMNGNEIILLNDMGNRRVDHAYLPEGYEPVGMKEYGGIIYIAAYNPITNMSLIGSFPSPLRRFNNVNNNIEIILLYYGENNPFVLSDPTTSPVFLLTDTYFKLLIDKPLIPGDKFITTYDKFDSNITKFNDNPNKLYSLYYGILNSQNLFVDITKNLILQNNHFLFGTFNVDNWQSLPVSDANFELNRYTYKMNTYSEKLIGYPYIKVLINHPINFRYSYTGHRDNNNVILKIIGTLEYNCPEKIFDNDNKNKYGFSLWLFHSDTVNLSRLNSPELSFNELELIDYPADLKFSKKSFIFPGIYVIEGCESAELKNGEKNIITNLYSMTIAKSYSFNLNNIQKIEGYLCVPVELDDPRQIYLKDISIPINLDLTLFGDNTFEITTWRFKKDDDGLKLKYNLNSYFSDNVTYKDLELKLTSINLTHTHEYTKQLDSLGGTITIPGLADRGLYKAEILYKTSLSDVQKTIPGNLWILNTHLFDICYNEDLNRINNYCNRTTNREIEIFNNLTTINLKITGNLKIDRENENLTNSDINNSYYSLDRNIKLELQHEEQYEITKNLNIEIDNLSNYPLGIENELNNKTYNLYLNEDKEIEVNESLPDGYINCNNISKLRTFLNKYKITTELTNGNKLKLTYNDIFDGIAGSQTIIKDVKYVFHNLSNNKGKDIIDEWIANSNNEGPAEIILFGTLSYDMFYITLNTGDSLTDSNLQLMDDHFKINQDNDGSSYEFFNTQSNENIETEYHPNYLRFRQDSCDFTNRSPFNIFMYRDHNYHHSDNSVTIDTPVVSYEDDDGQVLDIKYNSNYFLMYAKTYDENIDLDNQILDRNCMYSNSNYGNIRLGIIPGIVNTEPFLNSKDAVAGKIYSLFPNNTRVCTKPVEDIEVYTINTAFDESNTVYSYLKDFKYERNIFVDGQIDDGSNKTIEYNNTNLSFTINSKCSSNFSHVFKLNSYTNYSNLLYNIPVISDEYLDYETGKYIPQNALEKTASGKLYNYAFVPSNLNNIGFKYLDGIRLIYNANKTKLYPIFERDSANKSYRYMKVYYPGKLFLNYDTYYLDFSLFTFQSVDYRPYPIKLIEEHNYNRPEP